MSDIEWIKTKAEKRWSLEPNEVSALVAEIERLEKTLARLEKKMTEEREAQNQLSFMEG